MKIEFSPEAGETFDRILDALRGLAGEVTPEGGGEPIPCMLDGADHGDWLGTARIRRWDFDKDAPLGDWETIRVDSVLVY